ncbi:MAG: NAAT family transporter [Thiogranum sp.]|nr:NAAT family transporter [Thiogranum sp.]
MLETAVVAFTTLFATVGPIDVAAVFAALTASASSAERRSIALRGVITATVILLLFALLGKLLLASLGISLAALRTAGGILLLLIGIEMVFARSSGATSTTAAETREAQRKQDIAVFPLATPLLAGPGAMSSSILLMANAEGHLAQQFVVLLAILAVMLIALVSMLTASGIQRRLGVTGTHVITRIFGLLLSALAVQFMFDGIAESGLLGTG